MAKNLKINIKNTQIAQAINLSSVKDKLAKRKQPEGADLSHEAPAQAVAKEEKLAHPKEELPKEEAPRIRARSKSVFAAPAVAEEVEGEPLSHEEPALSGPETLAAAEHIAETAEEKGKKRKAKEEKAVVEEAAPEVISQAVEVNLPFEEAKEEEKAPTKVIEEPKIAATPAIQSQPHEVSAQKVHPHPTAYRTPPPPPQKLGPTGRHVKDLLPPKPAHRPPRETAHREFPSARPKPEAPPSPTKLAEAKAHEMREKQKTKGKGREVEEEAGAEDHGRKAVKGPKVKEFRDLKPARKPEAARDFDARDRQGLRSGDEETVWRKKRTLKIKEIEEQVTVRPTSLKVRIPISIKDLAAEMKLKASQLIAKLFLQGLVVTLNDLLEDEVIIQLLGQEFGCDIQIDTTEERRIRVTDQTVREEIGQTSSEILKIRPPVVAFMGHVDHGKTSLIDYIRSSNRAAGEAGAITQHIGAFRCSTAVGDIAILDTPGHEAFSAMRARGADVTDIVVLVVAGDEGIRQQTIEAIQHAKAAKVTIVVAINKCDKPNFNPELVYRQLADNDLLPEAWGGQIITVNCSAVTGQGVQTLLEMLALQAEVLELKANPDTRARGRVLESEMHKGLGAVATVLIQNGTLRQNDSLVFGQHWGRIKTMRDEYGQELKEASPSTPVQVTGLSGLPEAGQEFIVVKNEKEAREISEARMQGQRQINLQQKKKVSMEGLVQQASEGAKKVLNIVLRADVQGSLEALSTAIMKIQSKKVEPNIIFSGVGEVSESDIQLAAISKAVIIGFHTQVESHAEQLQKQFGVQIRLHNIIYHAVDDAKALMTALLDKIAQETEKGKAQVIATFKSSQHGVIAGCQVTEGTITRSNNIRVRRGNEVVWKGTIASLKRVKEDVREVQKGIECGILLNNFNDVAIDDVIEAYEVTYLTQEL